MRNQPDYLPAPMLFSNTTVRRGYGLALLTATLALLLGCQTNRGESAKGQRMTLNVGDIRELAMATRADTTWQLTATSDNQEVVDVARKPAVATTTNGTNAPSSAGSAIFLIKGVTAGTARVVFSEKQTGTDGNGRVKKTYLVTVANK